MMLDGACVPMHKRSVHMHGRPTFSTLSTSGRPPKTVQALHTISTIVRHRKACGHAGPSVLQTHACPQL